MKQVCLHCTREAPVGSLWCQEAYCATDDKPLVLESGESLGDIEVVRTLAILRTATVYEALRAGTSILLKIAHQGFDERLKREATFLAALRAGGSVHPALPQLLPAHAQAELLTYPYGKGVVQGHKLYYAVLAHRDGQLLRNALLQHGQPWFQHAVWLILSVADAVALMHQRQRLHLCLSPEAILVHMDRNQIPRPMLLDLGAVTRPDDMKRHWRRSFVPAAYVAPELLGRPGSKFGAFSDVYGLGLILYEMLSGAPAYDAGLRADAEVYGEILNVPPLPLNRPDLKQIPGIVDRAVSADYRLRPPNLLVLAQELQVTVPPVPRARRERRVSWRTVAVVLGAILAVALLLVMALSLGEAVTG
jgi:serine/threonine protein kinase